MSPRFPRAALVAAALLTFPATAQAATHPVPKGPTGAAFYTPPSPLPGARHGDLVRAHRVTGRSALKGAARTDVLLYRGTRISGGATAVSGLLSVPKGKAPKAGWPVITWAHGTTGIADACAPSRDDGTVQGGLTSYIDPLLQRWLKRGWAVARTDYEGLGTPGTHPYLVGPSEGRSVLDVVRAAGQDGVRLDTRRVIVAGHSQGGHAALWAAALAPRYTPELRVRGTVGFAPESHTGEQAQLIRNLTSPSGITGLAADILGGVEAQHPELRIASLLTDPAQALYPRVLSDCLPALVAPDAFGAFAPADLVRSDADLAPTVAALNANDTETLTIRTPVRVEQGLADTTVFPVYTGQLVDALRARGTKLTVADRKGVDHGGIVTAGAAGATSWIAARLK
jgi:pimeloyl-ACP methyl ester carboxylesterase